MVTQSLANGIAMDSFTALDPKSIALLLDVDGTLIDIGPSPTDVHVSDELRDLIARLSRMTGGALALVSGRPIADLDRMFAPLELPAIGGHGAEMRLPEGEITQGVNPLPQDMRQKLAGNAKPGSGILVEDKGYSLALHYRNVPQDADRLRASIDAGRAAFPGEATEVQSGKFMFEVKRPGVSKGEAVRALMREPPFAGRQPVFVGDDVTDESVFALLPDLKGLGFSVGRHFKGLAGIFDSPSQVRSALQRLAARKQSSPA
jgi:trehalose 6-phosphate phosphatase